jgi:uncharacterized protein (TIGR03435 family)
MVRGIAILPMVAVAAAQTGRPPAAFEVASVKLFAPQRPGLFFVARSDGPPSQFQISGTRVSTRGNLMSLVAGAYELERYQVSQGPDWTDKWATSEIYDIEARTPGDAVPTLAQVRQMMQTLLAERFHLEFSRQTTVTPVYNLVVAPGGAKIKPSAFTDAPMTRDEGSAGAQIRTRFLNYSMADFVRQMRWQFDRPLLDKTGLTGGFDFSLDYTAQPPGMTASAAAAMGLPDLEPGLPVIASIRGQLGLRVVAAREPVELLVIVHSERPSAN